MLFDLQLHEPAPDPKEKPDMHKILEKNRPKIEGPYLCQFSPVSYVLPVYLFFSLILSRFLPFSDFLFSILYLPDAITTLDHLEGNLL